MLHFKWRCSIFLITIFILMCIEGVGGEITYYTDENGVIHFNENKVINPKPHTDRQQVKTKRKPGRLTDADVNKYIEKIRKQWDDERVEMERKSKAANRRMKAALNNQSSVSNPMLDMDKEKFTADEYKEMLIKRNEITNSTRCKNAKQGLSKLHKERQDLLTGNAEPGTMRKLGKRSQDKLARVNRTIAEAQKRVSCDCYSNCR